MAPIVPHLIADVREDLQVPRDSSWVLSRRLATQRLSSAPLPSASEVVRQLGCVQCQDYAMGTWALGMRVRGSTYGSVLAEQRTGTFVRTHILRPTWHFVAAEDLRWMLRATSPKVEAGMAARHRQLELDPRTVSRGLATLTDVLSGRALSRKGIGALGHVGLPPAGEALGHLLLLAELRGVVCSGPPDGTEHTYALVDEVVPTTADDDLDRDEAVRRLTERFFAGHGPATDRDLSRWCGFTLAEIRAAAHELTEAGRLESTTVEGDSMSFAPTQAPRTTVTSPSARLLWIYDEAVLSYQVHGFRRSGGAGWRADVMQLVAGGVVVVDDREVGLWQRKLVRDVAEVRVRLDDPLTADERAAVEAAANRFAAFVERSLVLTVE